MANLIIKLVLKSRINDKSEIYANIMPSSSKIHITLEFEINTFVDKDFCAILMIPKSNVKVLQKHIGIDIIEMRVIFLRCAHSSTAPINSIRLCIAIVGVALILQD